MNMKTERVQGGVDGTALFEVLCKEVAVRYWGGPGESVNALVFGTGRQVEGFDDTDDFDAGTFRDRVNQLCRALGEGNGFRSDGTSRITAAGDGKLDLVVWRRFADRRVGQLIGFGQRKTGTNWSNDLSKLQPSGFCEKWMTRTPAVHPVRLYFVADRVFARWYENCKDGGIVFDRCRIMEYVHELPLELFERLRQWLNAALIAKGLSLT